TPRGARRAPCPPTCRRRRTAAPWGAETSVCRLLSQRQREHSRNHQAGGEDEEPTLEPVRALLEEPHHGRAHESADVPHRVDERDPPGSGGAAEKGGGQTPKWPQRAPDAGRRETERQER